MGYDAIAQRLGVSLSTVKRRMQAALTACLIAYQADAP
jgi:RNA polymerase sigma-70 factor (ECF subfamily)